LEDATRRRNTELVLVVVAVLASLFAEADAELALNGSLGGGFATTGLGLGALALLMHLAVRKWAKYADPLILPIAVLLSGLGLMMIHRLDSSYAKFWAGTQEAPPEAGSQMQWTVIAAVLFVGVIVFLKHHRSLQRYTYVTMAVSLVLQMAPAFFPGIYGAKRWIMIGPLSFEPDEFTKIGIIVFFASYLMANRDALALVGKKVWGISFPRMRDLGPLLVIWAISLLILIFEVDLGTSLIIFGIFIVMLYVATERTGWVLIGLVLAVVGGGAVGATSSHVGQRVTAWLHPMDVFRHGSNVTSDQAAQALFALGHGGFLGTGLGKGQPWLIGFAGRSDWILGAFGEELGTCGLMAMLLLYFLLAQRSWKSAITLNDPFGKLLGTGLAVVLVLQVFVVAGGVIGLIPETGKALPFLAYGGSATVANWLVVALMIKVSDAAGKIELEPAPDPAETMTVSTAEIRAHMAENQGS
jgi:cell division protein FtsW (lipid II flippase)